MRNWPRPARIWRRPRQTQVGEHYIAGYQELLKSDAVSKQDVDNFTGDFAAKQAMVQSAEANVSVSRILNPSNASTRRLRALSRKRNVDIGNLINAGNGGTSTKEMFDLAQDRSVARLRRGTANLRAFGS